MSDLQHAERTLEQYRFVNDMVSDDHGNVRVGVDTKATTYDHNAIIGVMVKAGFTFASENENEIVDEVFLHFEESEE